MRFHTYILGLFFVSILSASCSSKSSSARTCSGANMCTANEVCDNGTCICSGSASGCINGRECTINGCTCDNFNQCNSGEICDTSTGSCQKQNQSLCRDIDGCNGLGTCQGADATTGKAGMCQCGASDSDCTVAQVTCQAGTCQCGSFGSLPTKGNGYTCDSAQGWLCGTKVCPIDQYCAGAAFGCRALQCLAGFGWCYPGSTCTVKIVAGESRYSCS